jgi:PHD/YefM family antitoxin component YafN of YafNO toxin-antitoxin module
MTTEKLNADYEEILKDTIFPFFKSFKFRKKGQNFARTSNDIIQTFTVQKSLITTSIDILHFSFNFGFFNNEIHKIAFDTDDVIDFPITSDCFIHSSLGLYSHKRDHWYELSSRIDTKNVAGNVKDDLENHLKPLFNNYKSLHDLVRFTDHSKENKLITSPYEYIVFLMQTDQREKGEMAIRDNYLKAMAMKGRDYTNQFPYTQSETTEPDLKKLYLDNIKRLARLYNVQPVTISGKI